MKTFVKNVLKIASIILIFYSCQDNQRLVVPEDKKAISILNPAISNSKLSSSSNWSIRKSNAEFAFKFFKKIEESEYGRKNYMVSPLSLSMALGMVYNGSSGNVKKEFKKVLNYTQSISEINQFNKNLIDDLSSSTEGSIMKVANSIWINKDYTIKDEFFRVNSYYYDAKVSILNFGDSHSKRIINNWVSDKTNKKIPRIIGDISRDRIILLINAIYFNADWKYKFDVKNTKRKPFYIGGHKRNKPNRLKNIKVRMMEMEEVAIYYTENKLFSSVILPYKNDKFSMVVLLPNIGKTTGDIISGMSFENWNNWLETYKKMNFNLKLPKFKLEYKNKLKDELIEMGLENAFRPGHHFSNMTDYPGPMSISSVLQKTFIDVNEKGTEAAAVTAVDLRLRSVGRTPSFTVDRPFIYVIKENSTGAICFMGKVSKPKYKRSKKSKSRR